MVRSSLFPLYATPLNTWLLDASLIETALSRVSNTDCGSSERVKTANHLQLGKCSIVPFHWGQCSQSRRGVHDHWGWQTGASHCQTRYFRGPNSRLVPNGDDGVPHMGHNASHRPKRKKQCIHRGLTCAIRLVWHTNPRRISCSSREGDRLFIRSIGREYQAPTIDIPIRECVISSSSAVAP
jgi:hypothetical protein